MGSGLLGRAFWVQTGGLEGKVPIGGLEGKVWALYGQVLGP